jgi:multiple sugar transport system substrate-binding protein
MENVELKKLSLVLVLLVSIIGLSCSDHAQYSGGGDGIELTYWPAPNPEEITLADSIVRAWNRLHPDIHVRMQPIPVSQSSEEVLLAAIAGKTTPDVCSNMNPGALNEFIKTGGILPFDSFADFDSIASARTPRELLETFRFEDGRYYQLPWKTNPVMMFYNIKMLAAAGITKPPRTYSEYLADAQVVTKDTNGDGQMDIWMGERDIRPIWWQRMLFDYFPFYLGASGGKMLFTNGVATFDNAISDEVFQFFETCYAKHYFPRTFFQGGDPFLLQRKATHFAGPWEIPTIRRYASDLDFDVAPLPVPDDHTGPVYTTGDFKNISIFKTTKHPKEAWEFVKFLISSEHDLLLLRICNQVPVRGDLLTNPLFASYFRENPVMVKFAAQAPYTRGVDDVPDLKEIFDAISQEYEACSVFGKITPREASHDAAQRSEVILAWDK